MHQATPLRTQNKKRMSEESNDLEINKENEEEVQPQAESDEVMDDETVTVSSDESAEWPTVDVEIEESNKFALEVDPVLEHETEAETEAEVEEVVQEATEEEVVNVPMDSKSMETVVDEPVAEELVEVHQELTVPAQEFEVAEEKYPSVTPAKRELLIPGAFDWDSLDKKKDILEDSMRNELESLYGNTLKSINEQQVIDGTVVAKNTREVVVNIGYKSDGVISLAELRYRDQILIGDTIEVYVENQEDPSGQLILSHKKARILRSWERINQAMDQDEIINGFVKCRTKGGLIVDVFGIEAFLPGSQIDVKPIRDYDIYVGKTMEFKVVKINHEYKNVVVSHKALIQDELEKQKAEIIARLEKGQILEGTVKNITSYGVFIDLGGVDGLIHITDLSWGRINHPEEIVVLDDKINVVILDFDENKKRIALGLKQLTPHPWNSLSEELKVGDKVKGKVVVIADYGAFVEITTVSKG